MSGINERIAQLVPLLSRSKFDFAKAMGYTYNSVVENIVGKRQTKPGFEVLNTILKTFPQVNATWLKAPTDYWIVTDPATKEVMVAAGLDAGTVLVERSEKGIDIYVMSNAGDPWLFILKVMREAGEIWIRSIYPLKPAKRKSIRDRAGIEVFRE